MQEYEGNPTSISGSIYSDMVKEKALPAVLKVYPEGNAIWQDDGARIHRCPEALKAVEESFKSRIDPEIQAPKMADFWPIENVWAILKQKVASKSTNNVKELRAAITTAWIEISKDKKLCKKMIDSLPVRAQAVISKNGRQIFKKDYQ